MMGFSVFGLSHHPHLNHEEFEDSQDLYIYAKSPKKY